jgi:hypothetical protein
MMARSTFRPIRPKPLIATLTVIVISPLARTAVFGCWHGKRRAGALPGHARLVHNP